MQFLSTDAGKPGIGLGQPQHWLALLDSSGEGICGVDSTGNCTFINRTASDIFGFMPEEMLGQNMHLLTHHHRDDGTEYPAAECPVHLVLNGSQLPGRCPDTMFRKDASAFPAEVCAHPVNVDGLVVGAVITFRDLSEQRALKQELSRARALSEQFRAELETLMESIPHGVFIANMDGRVRLNERAIEMTGESFPKQLTALYGALNGAHSSETVCLSGPRSDRPSKASSKIWIQSVAKPVVVHGQIIAGIAVNTDVTQTRLQEDALRKAEKLAAVGQLASTIAHEINDPLESITNLLYLLQHSASMEEVQEYTNLAQTELGRVTEITQQTLRFNRQQNKPIGIEMASLIDTVLSFYTGRLLVRRIALERRLSSLPPVICHEGEVRQVLNNLVRNAIDAMEAGGKLIVRLRSICNGLGQRGVRVTIADSGEGISPDIFPHLFEPFRTTKEVTGTGLGLWVSKGIVDKHGGRISVRSRTAWPSGTVFSVWLPRENEGLHDAARQSSTSAPNETCG